jgi:hypothetical protein
MLLEASEDFNTLLFAYQFNCDCPRAERQDVCYEDTELLLKDSIHDLHAVSPTSSALRMLFTKGGAPLR